ncbi:hypothetical protein Cgig2_005025 [Carnegiea gigantea]|uniref:Alkyl transferase n=1 Tax=Carnegiea gigantea TaxID=171969 RepID=A0A9Q1KZT2_9CARY|nr:hypothetical protein Cgig2_005025 [Carnegiea gigantea]
MSSLHLSTTATTPFSLLKSNPPKRPPHSTSTHFHPSAAPLSLLRFQNLRRPSPEVAAAADVGAAVAEEELRRELMPRHVAVIMDGNVRWARQRGLPGSAGHEAGVQSLRNLVELCGKWGVQVLPVFAFSYDNWARPKVEVDFLMKLFEKGIQSELDIFIRTSGELRISNFLLWQLAYTELFFVRALWPDFGQEEFVEALKSFQQRNRRYGGRDLQASTGN